MRRFRAPNGQRYTRWVDFWADPEEEPQDDPGIDTRGPAKPPGWDLLTWTSDPRQAEWDRADAWRWER